ncbi:hypothetical protein CsSME_00022007 [Camellia sinensis var. sinensis]
MFSMHSQPHNRASRFPPSYHVIGSGLGTNTRILETEDLDPTKERKYDGDRECMTRKKDHDLRLANSLVTLLKYIETPCLLVCEETMVFSLQRLFILLICIGFFAVQSAKGSRLRSIDLFLRWSKEDDVSVLKYHHRTLKAVEIQAVNTEKKQAPVSKKFDPNQSSKRGVRKGSDPIHNRS